MIINRYTKQLFVKFARKVSGNPVKLPAGELNQINYLWEIVQNGEPEAEEDYADWIKINSILILSIWFTDLPIPDEKEILPLENIIKNFELGYEVEDYLVGGTTVDGFYQQLIRVYIDNPNYTKEQIENLLAKYQNYLVDEELAVADERLAWDVRGGRMDGIEDRCRRLLAIAPGERSDCYACIINRLVEDAIIIDQKELALEFTKVIKSEKLACDGVPLKTEVQELYLSDSPTSKQINYLNKKVKANAEYLFSASLLLNVAKRLSASKSGAKIMKKYDDFAFESHKVDNFYYLVQAFNLTGDQKYLDHATEIARLHDKRNGNDYYQNYLEQAR
ncbi:hypothetical protein [Xylocopilactobacillus apicola]|uniref:Uncharacterized protein n=1 Tax=Xylocopilactobacillus apicola TaxID=2932184 RepID=A0AAU9D421_9LACO|nr:hypothetical protein [Xylocopilactobacillus apicola]BDR58228.1 hypothetical protein XA3_06690 [Xylocopilactobacillus apicola]